MTRLAGEVADGLLAHGFTTARYLRERTLPLLSEGLAAAGRSRAEVTVSMPGVLVTGRSAAERTAAAAAVRATIAFYGSTPAYRPVLELHGWEAMADELHALSIGRCEDRWTVMRDLVDAEVLGTFAGPSADPAPRAQGLPAYWTWESLSETGEWSCRAPVPPSSSPRSSPWR